MLYQQLIELKSLLFSFFIIFSFFIVNVPNKNDSLIDWKIFIFSLFLIFTIITNLSLIKQNLRVFTVVLLFGAFSTLSLAWSHNTDYGLVKISYFWATTLPVTILLLIGTIKCREEDIFLFFKLLFFSGTLLSLIRIATGSFSFYVESNSLFGWSHVGFGRFISFSIVVIIFIMLKKKRNTLFYLLAFTINLIGLLMSGLRGAWLVVFILTAFLFLYFLQKDYQLYKTSVFRFSILFFLVISIFYFFNKYTKNEIINQRFEKILDFKDSINGLDCSFTSRYQGIIVSGQMIIEKPFWGRGVGGFNSKFKNYDIQKNIKYPHSIIIEVITEFGLIGLFIFSFLFFITFLSVWRTHSLLGVIYLTSFGLAFFSGHLFYQKILFAFTIFIFLDKNVKRKITSALKNI